MTATTVEQATKTCGACQQTKPLADFHKHASSSDGHRHTCASCVTAGNPPAPSRGHVRYTSMPRPSWGWQDSAACRGEDLDLFFGPDGERQPEREVRERKAKRICQGCPIRPDCEAYAISRPEKYGYWAAMGEDERASERRRRQRRANAA